VKKIRFIFIIMLIISSMKNAYADSVVLNIVGSDNSMPSYGLSLSKTIDNSFYATFEDLASSGLQTNTLLLSSGFEIGIFNFGPVIGTAIQTAGTTASGLAGAELGIKFDLSGPFFIGETNRVLRGSGGVSDSQVDLGAGVKF
jgi:hypothetical protein